MNHAPTPISSDRCDLAGIRSALEELVGARVGVELAPADGVGTFLTAIGLLRDVGEVGRPGAGAIAVEVGEMIVRITAGAFVGGWREEYADEGGGLRWRVIAVELRFGVVIEIEEIPAGSSPIR